MLLLTDSLDTLGDILSLPLQPFLSPEVICIRNTLYRVNILPDTNIADILFNILDSAIPYSTVVLRVRPTESGCMSEKYYVLVG